MKNKELFDRSVDVLTKAYINDTLRHGVCMACAVGNLVSAGIERLIGKKDYQGHFWATVCCTRSSGGVGVQDFSPENYKGVAKVEIDSTGYSPEEVARIEAAFEKSTPYKSTGVFMDRYSIAKDVIEKAMFEGLCDVYDCLCQIHEVTEVDNVTKPELVFVK